MSKVYGYVTERIIEAVERDGLLPWQKPWKAIGNQARSYAGRNYRGINALLCLISGRPGPWITYNKATEAGGTIKKGEKGAMVTFFKLNEYESKKTPGEIERVPIFRYYTVFSLEQTEGVPDPAWFAKIKAKETPELNPEVLNPIQAAEGVWEGFKGKPEVVDGGGAAYYMPALDRIGMPKRETFKTPEGFYATLYHEGVHSTGHFSRLGRNVGETARFGSTDYSKEELVAEIGAAFLCAEAGIGNDRLIENQAAYVKNWLSRLRDDPKLIVQAAGLAQKAADHIVGRTFGEEGAF